MSTLKPLYFASIRRGDGDGGVRLFITAEIVQSQSQGPHCCIHHGPGHIRGVYIPRRRTQYWHILLSVTGNIGVIMLTINARGPYRKWGWRPRQ